MNLAGLVSTSGKQDAAEGFGPLGRVPLSMLPLLRQDVQAG